MNNKNPIFLSCFIIIFFSLDLFSICSNFDFNYYDTSKLIINPKDEQIIIQRGTNASNNNQYYVCYQTDNDKLYCIVLNDQVNILSQYYWDTKIQILSFYPFLIRINNRDYLSVGAKEGFKICDAFTGETKNSFYSENDEHSNWTQNTFWITNYKSNKAVGFEFYNNVSPARRTYNFIQDNNIRKYLELTTQRQFSIKSCVKSFENNVISGVYLGKNGDNYEIAFQKIFFSSDESSITNNSLVITTFSLKNTDIDYSGNIFMEKNGKYILVCFFIKDNDNIACQYFDYENNKWMTNDIRYVMDNCENGNTRNFYMSSVSDNFIICCGKIKKTCKYLYINEDHPGIIYLQNSVYIIEGDNIKNMQITYRGTSTDFLLIAVKEVGGEKKVAYQGVSMSLIDKSELIEKKCEDSSEKSLFNPSDGKCYKECPSNKFIFKDSKGDLCLTQCPNEKRYHKAGEMECLSNIPSGYSDPEGTGTLVENCTPELLSEGKNCFCDNDCRSSSQCTGNKYLSSGGTCIDKDKLDNILDMYQNGILNIDNGDSTTQIIDTDSSSTGNSEGNNEGNGNDIDGSNGNNNESAGTNGYNNVSLVILGTCEEVLKIKNDIPNSEGLLIYKVDTYNSKSIINNVEFKVFAKNGTELNLNDCKNEEIQIVNPIYNDSEFLNNIDEGLFNDILKENIIDISDGSDPFFNDICKKYDIDIPFQERKKYFFPEMCSDNCKPKQLNSEKKELICSCFFNEENNKEKKFKNKLESHFKNTNFGIISCYKNGFKNVKENISFWINTSAFVIQTITIIAYSVTNLTSKLNKLVELFQKLSSPYKKKKTEVDSSFDNHSKGITIIPYINQEINSHRSNQELLSKEKELINKYEKAINSQRNNADFDYMDYDVEKGRSKKKIKEYNSTTIVRKKDKTSTKSILKNNIYTNDNNSLGKPNVENIYHTHHYIQNNSYEITEKKLNFEEFPSLLNHLPFIDVIKFDKRSFGNIYKDIFVEKQFLFNIFCNSNDINYGFIKYSSLIMNLLFIMYFNALLLRSSVKMKYFLERDIPFLYCFMEIFLSWLISGILIAIINLVPNFYSSFLRYISPKYKKQNKNPNFNPKKFSNDLSYKFVIYYVICFSLSLYMWFYMISFYAVNKFYYMIWVNNIIKSFFLFIFYPIIHVFFISFFRFLALSQRVQCFYIISEIMNFF